MKVCLTLSRYFYGMDCAIGIRTAQKQSQGYLNCHRQINLSTNFINSHPMKKEVLISLLMTPPVAFNAMADINTNEIPDAASNSDYYKSGWNTEDFEVNDGKVVGTSVATFTKSVKLVPGDYRFSVKTPKNVFLEVYANGKTVSGNTEWVGTTDPKCEVEGITLESETEVTIKVSSMNNASGSFELSGIDVIIVFDQEAAADALQEKLEGITFDEIAATSSSQAQDLARQVTALEERKKVIKNRIDAIGVPTTETDHSALYQAYKDEELFLYPDADKITKDIESLATEAETLNAKIKAELDRQTIQADNKAAYDEALKAITDLNTKYGELTTKYEAEGASEYAKAQIKDEYEAIGSAINAYEQRIKDAFLKEDGTVVDSEDVEFTPSDEENGISKRIDDALAAFDAFTADDEAYDTMVADIEALKAAYDKAITDITAVKGVAEGLGFSEGGEISFKVDYTDVYSAGQTDAKHDIAELYNAAIKTLDENFKQLGEGATKTPENIGGSAEIKENYGSVAPDAKAAIEKIVADLQALAGAQNELMTNATAKAKELNGLLTEDIEYLGKGKDYKFPETVEELRAGYANDFREGINTLTTDVPAAYTAHELAEDDFSDSNETVAAINEAINNLKKLKDSPAFDAFTSLIENLDAIKALIAEKDAALDEIGAEFPFSETFNSAVTKAEDKLNGIDPTKLFDDTTLKEIADDFDDLKTHVEELYASIFNAYEVAHGIDLSVDSFEKALNDKTYIEGIATEGKDEVEFFSAYCEGTQHKSLNGWKSDRDQILSEYKAICNMNGDDQGVEIREAADELYKKLTEGTGADYQRLIDSDKDFVLTEISRRNLDVAENKAEEITDGLDEYIATVTNEASEGLPGYGSDKMGTGYLSDIEAEINKISTAINAAASAEDTEAALATQDEAIQKLIDGLIAERVADAKALTDNHEAYLELKASIEDVKEAIDASRNYNEENSTTDGAKAYYEGLLKGYEDELAELETEVKGAYEKGSAADNATSQKDALTTALSDLEKNAQNIIPTIDANEQGYKDMVALSKEILGELNAAYTSLSENSDFEAILDEIASKLNALDGESLADYEKGVFGDAGNNNIAEAAAEVQRLEEAYEALRDEIKTALGEGLDDYNQGIKDANDEMFSTLWAGPDADLWEAYNKAIGDYQYYRDTNTNKSYQDYLADYIAQSAVIYDYYKIIRDLEDEINDYKNECNSKTAEREDFVLMDEEMFTGKGGYLARAEAISEKIAAKVTELEANAKLAAENYYTDLTNSIGETITNATNAMAAAGVTAEYSEEAVLSTGVHTSLSEAQTAYGNGDDQVNAEDDYDKNGYLARRMHLIADYLDAALNAAKAIDMQAAAEKEWADVYAAAGEKLEALKTQLDGCKSADEDIYNTSVENLAEQIATAAAIDTEATADTDLINEKAEADNKVLGDYKAALEDAIKAATEAVDASQDSHDANVANEALYADYIADYDNLILRYESLVAFVETLAADTTCSDAAIQAFKTAIDETYRHSLAANEDAIATLYDAASASISAGLQAAAESEIDWLKDELEVIKTAFNDARTKGEIKTDEADVYDEKIANLRQNVEDLEAAIPAESGLTADAAIINLQEGMLNLEKAMCNLEAELNGLAGQDNRADAISETLNQACDEILAAIADGKAFVAGDDCNERTKADYEAGEFDANYAALEAEIEAVKAAIKADGNAVIAHQGNFDASIKEIRKNVTDLTEAIYESDATYDADDARAAANQAAYEAITTEYEAAVSAWNEAFERLVAYKYDQYVLTTEGGITLVAKSFSNIYQAIENAYASRTQQYDEGKGSLTEDDTLFDYSYDVYAAIDHILSLATKDELNGWISAAKSTVSTAQTTLPTNIVSAVRAEIVAELANLATRANALESTYTNAEDEVEAWAPNHIDEADRRLDEAKAIIDAVAEQNALAEENTFVIGDVNVDKNVDAIDFQMMVNLIGNDFDGTAYETEELIVREAADINGNRMFDAGDLVAIADICMNYNPWGVRAAMFAPAVQGDNHVGLQLVSEENGISRYAVEITNAATFVAGQMNILVPAGMEVVEISTADRADAQDLYRFDNSNGNVRLVLASMSNEAIEGNQGAVVYIDVTGRGRLDIDNVIFADARGVIYTLSKDLTGVNSPLIDTLRNAKEAIYNVAGQAMDSLRRGFNIVRKSDGTTSKEYRK